MNGEDADIDLPAREVDRFAELEGEIERIDAVAADPDDIRRAAAVHRRRPGDGTFGSSAVSSVPRTRPRNQRKSRGVRTNITPCVNGDGEILDSDRGCHGRRRLSRLSRRTSPGMLASRYQTPLIRDPDRASHLIRAFCPSVSSRIWARLLPAHTLAAQTFASRRQLSAHCPFEISPTVITR